MSSVNIYAFTDYHAFLRAWFIAKKRRPSQATFAQRVGCSKATVSLVASGRRQLQDKWVDPFADELGLDAEEREYFKLLVARERAPTEELSRMIQQRVNQRAEMARSVQVTEGTARLFRHWYIAAVAELAECEGFREDPVWIANRMNPKITPEQVSDALETLFAIGRLKRVKGRVVGDTPPWVTKHQLTPSLMDDAVRVLHADISQLAARSLTAFDHKERLAIAVALPVPKRLFAKLQASIVAMVEEVIHTAQREEDQSEVVLQLATYLFPLSDSDDEA